LAHVVSVADVVSRLRLLAADFAYLCHVYSRRIRTLRLNLNFTGFLRLPPERCGLIPSNAMPHLCHLERSGASAGGRGAESRDLVVTAIQPPVQSRTATLNADTNRTINCHRLQKEQSLSHDRIWLKRCSPRPRTSPPRSCPCSFTT